MMISVYIWVLIIGACWSKVEESGKQECIGNLCENTVYEIKIHAPERTSDLFTSGSRSQCRSQANKYLLKFLIPSDVQWLKNGAPITMFNPYCGSFIAYDGVKNELDEMDNGAMEQVTTQQLRIHQCLRKIKCLRRVHFKRQESRRGNDNSV
uniref:Uncharacterized protein n=1 Tax=Romanomermis culicivorax TaxID=13658 RepID=A0A915HFB4_ROMCU